VKNKNKKTKENDIMNKFKKGDKVKWDSDGQVKYGIFHQYFGADDLCAYVFSKNEGINKTCWVSALSPAEEPERKFKKGDRVKWEYKGKIQYGIFDGYSRAENMYAYVIFKNEGIKTCCVSNLSPAEEPERKFKIGNRVKWEYKGEIHYGIFDGYDGADDMCAYIIFEDGKVEICYVSDLSLAEEPERKFKQGDKVKWECDGQVKYGIFDGYYRADDMCAYIIFEDGKVEIYFVSNLSPAEEPANDSADETVGDKEDPTELPASFVDKLMRDNIAATIYGRLFQLSDKINLEYITRESFDAADIFMKIRREKQK